MKTELSWNFIGLVAAFGGAGAALIALPDFAPIATFAFVLLGWVISLCLHEYAHAATAAAFGDTTIAGRGYLSLNPVLYFTGATSLILPVIALVLGGIAFPGGAVRIRPDLIRERWQQSFVALAGPGATLIATVVCYLTAQGISGNDGAILLHDALILLTFFELMAFVLNMLPVPGLDGFGAVVPWLPKRLTAAIPPQVSGLITLGLLVIIFAFGFRIILPIMGFIVHGLGLDLSAFGAAYHRFHFWGRT